MDAAAVRIPSKRGGKRGAASTPRLAKSLGAARGAGGHHALELTALVERLHDVGPADELAVQVELRNGRPARVLLDALAKRGVLQHVVAGELDAQPLQNLGGHVRE